MKRLQNKIAVVTGGNSGIGKGIAEFFHQEGAKVVIFGRNKETLEQTKNEIKTDVLAVQGDVTKTEDLKKLYEATSSQFGKIDILVANSGIGARISFQETTEENFDDITNTNYRGLFFTVRYALPFLNKNASIILISSIAAVVTIKNQSVYASNKAAVTKLAKNLACDLSDQLIRVNSISPGYIRTPIFDERLAKNPDYLKEREPHIPLKRIGTPLDIAHAALFLASDESSYITGADLLVDGGYCSAFREA